MKEIAPLSEICFLKSRFLFWGLCYRGQHLKEFAALSANCFCKSRFCFRGLLYGVSSWKNLLPKVQIVSKNTVDSILEALSSRKANRKSLKSLLHSERQKLCTLLAFLSAIGLNNVRKTWNCTQMTNHEELNAKCHNKRVSEHVQELSVIP